MAAPLLYDRVKETTTTTGTGTLTLAGAATGFRSFSAVGNGNTCFYTITDGTNWEVGVGTYTSSGTTLSRDEILASSNSGSAVNFSSGTKDVFLNMPAAHLLSSTMPVLPQGRLTLTTGVPVPTSDVSSSGSIYYTPSDAGNRIDLWNGRRWVQTEFSEKTLSLSSLTSGTVYDVFGYLNGSGALELDTPVAWSTATARATAITQTDGLWTKSGAKTRLLLGSFRATGTGTTKDTITQRFLSNAYNEEMRPVCVTEANTSWTWTTNSYHQVNADTANQVEAVFSIGKHWAMFGACAMAGNSGSALNIGTGVGIDSTTVNSALVEGGYSLVGSSAIGWAWYVGRPGIGYHYFPWLERSVITTGTTTWRSTGFAATLKAGLFGFIMG